MMPMDSVTLGFGAALMLGLSFGAGPCNIACLPYLGPVFMTSSQGVRGSWRTLVPFSLGRLSGYTLLGTGAGLVGLLVQDWIAGPWGRWLLGGATILVALAILRRRTAAMCGNTIESRPVKAPVIERRHAPKAMLPGGLFLMGAGMAFNPCTPLTTVLLAASATASAGAGLSLGLGFGLGAVVIPTFVFALGMAHFGSQVRVHLSQWRHSLENASVGLLLLLGAGTALGWIAP